MTCLSGSELQRWRREQLTGQQGEAAALDWLLELEAGLPWPELQASYLHPETTLQLRMQLSAGALAQQLLLHEQQGSVEALPGLFWRPRHTDTDLTVAQQP